jgi:hypothetical protein
MPSELSAGGGSNESQQRVEMSAMAVWSYAGIVEHPSPSVVPSLAL